MKVKKIKRIGIGFFAVVLLSSLAWAVENGGLAMPLTQEGGTARAMAMGSAVVSVPQGSASLFWNPAGLGILNDDCMEIGLHHNSGLGDSIHETAVIGMPISYLGGFAASLNYVNNGTFEKRDSVGNRIGDYTAGDMGISLGWGKQFLPGISAGLAVKFNQQTLASKTYSAFASDAGLLWNPLSRLNLGLTYANLGTKVADKNLDSGLRAGASYGVNKKLLLAASSELKSGEFDRLQLGIESLVHPMVAIRAGYVHNLKDTKLEELAGVTAGLGIKIVKNIMIDYAYVPFGELGISHRISLTYRQVCPEKVVEKVVEIQPEVIPAPAPAPKPVVKPAPIVSGLNPNLGPAAGGTVIEITGSGFTDVPVLDGVMFGAYKAVSYLVYSDTKITAIAPAHAEGTVNIVATSPWGSSPIVAEDIFTYSKAVPIVEPVVIVLEDTYFTFDEKTHFKFDSVALTKEGLQAVIDNTQILRDHPETKIRIAGYASASGTEEYNQKLSERRAKAVEEILVKENGIAPERITTIGYGEMRPAEFEITPKILHTAAAKANKRVLFEIIVK